MADGRTSRSTSGEYLGPPNQAMIRQMADKRTLRSTSNEQRLGPPNQEMIRQMADGKTSRSISGEQRAGPPNPAMLRQMIAVQTHNYRAAEASNRMMQTMPRRMTAAGAPVLMNPNTQWTQQPPRQQSLYTITGQPMRQVDQFYGAMPYRGSPMVLPPRQVQQMMPYPPPHRQGTFADRIPSAPQFLKRAAPLLKQAVTEKPIVRQEPSNVPQTFLPAQRAPPDASAVVSLARRAMFDKDFSSDRPRGLDKMTAINKNRLDRLVSQVDPRMVLDDNVKAAVIEIQDEFIDELINHICKLAENRGVVHTATGEPIHRVEAKDAQMVLEAVYKMPAVPRMAEHIFGRGNGLTCENPPASSYAHQARMRLIRETQISEEPTIEKRHQ